MTDEETIQRPKGRRNNSIDLGPTGSGESAPKEKRSISLGRKDESDEIRKEPRQKPSFSFSRKDRKESSEKPSDADDVFVQPSRTEPVSAEPVDQKPAEERRTFSASIDLGQTQGQRKTMDMGQQDRGMGTAANGITGSIDLGPTGSPGTADTDGPEVGDDGEVLPDLALEPVGGELLAEDRIGLPDHLEPVAGDRSETADAQPGAGERLAVDHRVGQTEGLPDHTDLILEEELHRLHELEFQILREASDVVVGLHGAALEDVGVDGPLCEEVDTLLFPGLLLEHADELRSDDLPLLFGLGDALQLREEAVDGVDVHEVGVHLVAEHLHHLLRLPLPEEPVVDVHAHQVLPYGAYEQGGDHGGVHTSAECQQHLPVADLGPDLRYLLVDEGVGELGGGDPHHVVRTFVSVSVHGWCYAVITFNWRGSGRRPRTPVWIGKRSERAHSHSIVAGGLLVMS